MASEASKETARKIVSGADTDDGGLAEVFISPSYLAAIIDADKRELVKALQDLYDVQNGSPLVRDEQEWNDAMRRCDAALTRHTPKEDTPDA